MGPVCRRRNPDHANGRTPAIFPRVLLRAILPAEPETPSAAEAENPARAGGSKPDGSGNMVSGCYRTNTGQKSSAGGRQLVSTQALNQQRLHGRLECGAELRVVPRVTGAILCRVRRHSPPFSGGSPL